MKKLFFFLFFVMFISLLTACDKGTTSQYNPNISIDCLIGYITSGNKCVDDPNTIVIDNELYAIFYEDDNYTVYQKVFRSDVGTCDVVFLGDYNGYVYYFGSGTVYNFYKVVKGEEIKDLNQAMEAEWFYLENLVLLFNIEEVYSYPIEE